MATNEPSVKKKSLAEQVKEYASCVSCVVCYRRQPVSGSSSEEQIPLGNIPTRPSTDNLNPSRPRAYAQYGTGTESDFTDSDEKSQRVKIKLPEEGKPHSLENFTSYTLATFCSQHIYNSYHEMWEDVKRWTSPLRNHPTLHSEFLSYASKKFKYLEDLMTKLQGCLSEACHQEDEDIKSITQNLSVDTRTRKDQMKVMILLSDVFMKFPSHIVEQCVNSPELTQSKRESLIQVMTGIPYDVKEYSLEDEDMSATTAFLNGVLQPIMKRIGFSKQKYTSTLQWTAKGDFHLLAGGFFLIWGTFCTSL